MILDEILAHNRKFVSQTRPRDVPSEPTRRACVVACMDSRLVDFLVRALGIGRGEADLICTAGNTITPHDNAIVRSVSASVILHHVKEVLVVGHTDCGMASDVLPLTEAMESAGISRSDVGSADLREFFGLTPPPETNARQVVDALRRSPVIPPEVLIHGLLLDLQTGALRLIVKGEAAPPRRRAGVERLPEVDLEAVRAPEVHVAAEEGAPVSVLLGPSAPAATPPTVPPARRARPPQGVVLRPSPGKAPQKPEPPDVEIVLGPAEAGPPSQPPPTPLGPVAPPPPTPLPTVTIDVGPSVGPAKKAPKWREPSARRARVRKRPGARPAGPEDLDIRLGPVKRRRPPRR